MVKHHTNLCMRIGIDLDGVIFDSEKLYRIYSELYDIQDLKKNSITSHFLFFNQEPRNPLRLDRNR